jgi:predicted metal-dependent enzyme (double-stranded beta helix superfamily)
MIESIRSIVAGGVVDEPRLLLLETAVREALPRLMRAQVVLDPPPPGRYLCYKDTDYGFVVMLLAWGKGDGTPIHDHGTWGVEAVLRDALIVTEYSESETDPRPLKSCVMAPGAVMHNLPPARDVHKVQHHAGERALSMHVYGREMTGNRMFVPGEGYKVCALACGRLETGFDLSGLCGAGVERVATV